MYRVLIVDDEEPVLESFAYLVESRPQDLVLAGKARSGLEAIKAIHETRPDVVFMDIHMPGIDGIQVIEEIHQQVPQTLFVVATAFERFDLAQRAIPLGVFSYLVKPISKRTFLDTLDHAIRALEQRRGALGPEPRRWAELQFLKESIWREMSEDDWSRHRNLLGLHSDKALVCLLEVEEDAEPWCARVAERLSFKHRLLWAMVKNRAIFLISGDPDREALEAQVRGILEEVLPPSLERHHALGSACRGPRLFTSCLEAMDGLSRQKNRAELRVRERVCLAKIRRGMGITPLEELRKTFTALWQEIFQHQGLEVAKGKLVALLTLLLDDCNACYRSPDAPDPPLDPAEEIMPMTDQDELEVWSLNAFNSLYRDFTQKRTARFPLPLAKALAFVERNYTQAIQLSSAAEAAQVSPAYLSRLFTEHLDTTFIDHLTVLRTEKAEHLIRETSMHVKEISWAVGYQDPNYFSKVFRKATGMSPTMYALQHRGTTEDA